MSIAISNTHETEKETMSHAYAVSVLNQMKLNPMVMELEADLGRSLLGEDILSEMKEKYSKQFIDCGIQEANMMSVAAGLSVMNRIPFIHTFAAFASRRITDQTFISGSYAKANVRIIGSDPGITAQYNGGTHMSFEDVGIYRSFPDMTILEPTDTSMIKDIIPQLARSYGMYYVRLYRKNAIKIYESGTKFKIGYANLLNEGTDATIIAAGAMMVPEALQAAELLKQDDISVRVLDMFTIKPIDYEAVICAANDTGAIVTAENHNVIGGLGSAVSEILASSCYAPLEMIGVKDRFGEVGSVAYLKDILHLTAVDIANAVKTVVSRK